MKYFKGLFSQFSFLFQLVLAFVFLGVDLALAQSAGDVCYAVADGYVDSSGSVQGNSGADDTLAFLNRLNGNTGSVDGNVPNIESTRSIEAIAFVPTTNLMYAANASQLGTLNLTNGDFTALPNTFGSAQGYLSGASGIQTVNISDVDGLTYDFSAKTLWGAHRKSGPDLLVAIDLSTGSVIPNSFNDPFNPGSFVDFLEIQTTSGLADIDDLASDPSSGLLYAIANQGGSGGKLVIIDPADGSTTEVGDFIKSGTTDIVNDFEGLSFFNDGTLYGSTGNSYDARNQLFQINKSTAEATLVGPFTNDLLDIEALACLTSQASVNIEVSANGSDADSPTGPNVNEGDSVTFVYQVTNTGGRKLIDLVVSDPEFGVICTIPELNPGDTNSDAGVTCQKTVSASAGQYASSGQVAGEDIFGADVNDSDPVHYFGIAQFFKITGLALFQGTNAPVPGVTITSTGGFGSKLTNFSGYYVFTGVPNGSYTLTASKPNFVVVSQNFTNPVQVSGANQTNKNFILACAQGYEFNGSDCVKIPTFTISGFAVFQGTNAPVPGVTITSTGGLGSKQTNANGAYSFTGVVNGSYSLTASKPNFVVVSQNFTNPVQVNGANQPNKNFVLACAQGYEFNGSDCVKIPTYKISGFAVFQGTNAPVPGVTITSTGGLGSKQTNPNGAYSFGDVSNGSYTLGASKPNFVVVSQNFTNPVQVNGANQPNKNFILACAEGYEFNGSDCIEIPTFTISGFVIFEGTNAPVPGVTIVSSGGLGSTQTNPIGAYAFNGVPNGDYTLSASKPNFVVVSQNFTNPVQVNGANQPFKNFILACAEGYELIRGDCIEIPRFTISGFALFEGTNAPVSGVTVTADGGFGSEITNELGAYEFTGVPNGDYVLSASKPNFVIVSQNFANPVQVNGADEPNKNFILACAEGYQLQGSDCIETPDQIIDEASDGTFPDYVLVTWNPSQNGTSYTIYRSEVPGELGDPIVIGHPETSYKDTSAIPDKHYFYTIVSDDGVTSNQDEGWRPGSDDQCLPGQECIHEELDPFACASANGFLGQVNIATTINQSTIPLDFKVEYRDLFGVTKGVVEANIAPLQKMDFIINDLGLEPDTYGTVCVTVDTEERGAWSGGVSLYKADERDGEQAFGAAVDFVLYYPFTNPRTGSYTLPLNTFHLGVRQDGTIANWIRITDAEPGDGERLRGELLYFDEQGKLIKSDQVDLPDGGRFDFSGHEGLAGIENVDAVGMARFVPESKGSGEAAPVLHFARALLLRVLRCNL